MTTAADLAAIEAARDAIEATYGADVYTALVNHSLQTDANTASMTTLIGQVTAPTTVPPAMTTKLATRGTRDVEMRDRISAALTVRNAGLAGLEPAISQLIADLSTPSGKALSLEPYPGFELAFAEDFSKVPDVTLGSFPAAMSARWWAYPYSLNYPWKNTAPKGWGIYDPLRTISIHDGIMDLWPHTVPGTSPVAGAVNGIHLCACPVPLVPGSGYDAQGYPLGQLYGRFETRWRIPYAFTGSKLAWLGWPDDKDWPRNGEWDFPEGNCDGNLLGFMHRQDATSGSDQDVYNSGQPIYGRWRTTVVEWLPNSFRLLVDGQQVAHWTSRVPNTSMRLGYQTETVLRPDPEPLPGAGGHVEIAHTRIDRLAA